MTARERRFAASAVVGLLVLAATAAGEGRAAADFQIFSGEPRLIIVNGYSTSFHWPDLLQRKLDRYFDSKGSKGAIEVRKATRSSSPIARWIDVETGQPKEPWQQVRDALKKKGDRPAIVLGQQSLQMAFGKRGAGIRSSEDRERIEQGAAVIKKYARRLLEDGADEVFIAMHIYKHPMEPEIGNERLALAEFLKGESPHVHAGPDVWTPTKRHYPKAFARDRLHPGPIGNEIVAQLWFEALLKHDGLEIPQWSRDEMDRAVADTPSARP